MTDFHPHNIFTNFITVPRLSRLSTGYAVICGEEHVCYWHTKGRENGK